MEDKEYYQKVKLVKDGNHQSIYYENTNSKMYRELNENEYDKLFSKLRPNIEFSLPDKLIQTFVKDGSILPSFKESPFFTKDDFRSIVSPLKSNLMIHNNSKHSSKSKSLSQYKNIRRKSKKGKRQQNKQNKKRIQSNLLKSLSSTSNVSRTNNKTQKKRNMRKTK